MVMALAVFAPLFMSIFGRDFRVGASGLVILACGALFATVTGPSGATLLMAGNALVNLMSTLLAVSVNLGLDFWLIPKFGLDGAAWAWAFSMLAMNAFQAGALVRLFQMHPLGREFAYLTASCVFCFGLYGGLIRLVVGDGVAAFVIYAVGAVCIYAIILVRGRRFLRFDALAELRRYVYRRSSASGMNDLEAATIMVFDAEPVNHRGQSD